MMVRYALERRHPRLILAFAGGCLLSSVYGFLAARHRDRTADSDPTSLNRTARQ
jgi:hypothetical protein